MKTLQIAVYGTLKRGGRLNAYMQPSTFLGEDHFPGVLYSWGQVPAALPGDGLVHCEVWECPETVVRHLDAIEGHPWAYRRSLVKTSKFGEVWAYIYQGRMTGARLLEDGFFDALKR